MPISEERYLLGLDIGTTTCRALVVTTSGETVASAATEIAPKLTGPVAAEVDPETWWDGTVSVVRSALGQGKVDPGRITGIGLSGLMHAPVLLNEQGGVAAAAPLWMDQRSQAASLRLADLAERGGLAWADVRTSVTASKLRWWLETDPRPLREARVVLLPKDFIRYRLTGVVATEPSDAAGTGLIDPSCGQWHEGLAANAGVSLAMLPPIRAPHERGGTVTPAAAASTGLRAGTPVAIGGSDGLCTRVGIGPLSRGTILAYLGTAAWVAVSDGADTAGCPRAEDRGATTATGAALRWLRDTFPVTASMAGEWSYDDLVLLCRDVAAGAEGLFFFPHMMGERGPVNAPSARAAWVGLTLHHRLGHLVRSVLEGTAFQFRRVLEEGTSPARGASVICCGGVCRSAQWMQIIADVTGLTLQWPSNIEAAALGAAILGGKACGVIPPGRVVDWNPVAGTVRPRADLHAAYDAMYGTYCSIDSTLLP